MPPRRNPIRYAHSEGHTDVCYAEDGSHILTCGQDGDVRIWSGLDDDDPTSQCVGEKAIAVAHKGDHFYVGTDNNHVQAYTFPDANRDQIITRFSAPVTHVVVSYSGKKIVAGSCDMEIHIFDLETSKSQVLTGHTAPILGVSIDPKEKYVVSSSCDGTIRAWDLESSKSVNTWNCLKSCNSFYLAESLGRTSWQPPSGRHVAIPAENEVILYERASWEKVASLASNKITKFFTIVSFSACGTYVAAATIGGEICVWNVNNHSCIMYVKHEQNTAICGLVWNPSGNGELAYCDVNGQLGTIEECIPQVTAKLTEDDSKVMTTLPMPAFDNDDDDDDENVFALEKIKASVPLPGFLEDAVDTDIEAHSIAGLEDDTESKIEVVPRQELLCDIQPPFQPTSSPVHLQHRYMVWNSVGIIRSYDTEEENSIDIEFHDISTHHAIHMTNFLKHTLAALSDEATVLACEANEDMPSKLVCILLSAWDGSKEWSVDLPDGEEILAVSVGQGWIAVATDTRNLRLFTVGGTQREVLSLPGPIVCLNGHKNKLFVVYHDGAGLSFILLNVSARSLNTITSFQPLPQAPKTTLHWAGFSDEGSACTVDSSGMVRIFSPRGYWQPICDTKTKCPGKSDHYFILGISEKYQTIRGILCKGSRYPPTTPKPTVAEIPIKLPLCEPITEKSELEELYWHSRLSFTSLDSLSKIEPGYVGDRDTAEKTIRETIIKLFALACRSGLEHRALELSGLMPSQQVVQLAVKYASKLGKRHLAERLTEEGNKPIEDFEEINLQSSTSQPRHTWDDPRRPVILQEHVTSWSNSASGDYDPFTSSQETQSSEQGNILLASSERKSLPVIRPTLPLSNKKSNPFKKNSERTQIGKGLTNMTSSFMSQQNMKSKEVNAQPLTISKAKESKITSKSSTPSDTAKKGTLSFIQWFSQEKPALQEEFPDMSSSELTREAMKRYNELSQKQKMKKNLSPDIGNRNIQSAKNIGSNNSDIQVMSVECSGDTIETPNEGKKRKAESTDFSNAENVTKKSHTDLLKFSFQK